MSTLFNKYFIEPTMEMVIEELEKRPLFRWKNGIRGKGNRSPEQFAETFVYNCKKTGRYEELSLYFEIIQNHGLLAINFGVKEIEGIKYLNIKGHQNSGEEKFKINEIKESKKNGLSRVKTNWSNAKVDFFIPPHPRLHQARTISLEYELESNAYIPLQKSSYSKKNPEKLVFPIKTILKKDLTRGIIPLSEETQNTQEEINYLENMISMLSPDSKQNSKHIKPHRIKGKAVIVMRGVDESYEHFREFFYSKINSPISIIIGKTEYSRDWNKTTIDGKKIHLGKGSPFNHYILEKNSGLSTLTEGINMNGILETDNGYRYEGDIYFNSRFSDMSFFPFFKMEDNEFNKNRKQHSPKESMPAEITNKSQLLNI